MAECCVDPAAAQASPCCCGGSNRKKAIAVNSRLSLGDILGRWKARWGIGRMNFKVEPGLYALNGPDRQSPVVVTANYKMTFDILRRHLDGIAAWVLVLDTKGVNVWCAAGKGTFGTQELIERVDGTGLAGQVDHRQLILPQLGAPGVAAHLVQQATGFKCAFGPVRAGDLPEYLTNGGQATGKMRQVDFPVRERIALCPMELVPALKAALPVFGLMFLLNLVVVKPLGIAEFIVYGSTIMVGCLLGPLFLPVLPGRAFSQKGFVLGLLWAWFLIEYLLPALGFGPNLWQGMAYVLLVPALCAIYLVLFTGSTPFTSLSGVEKELKRYFPLLMTMLIMGLLLAIVWRF